MWPPPFNQPRASAKIFCVRTLHMAVSLGRRVSGRVWKDDGKQASQRVFKHDRVKSWEKRKLAEMEAASVKALERELREEKEREKEAEKQRRREKRERKLENERKSQIYQTVSINIKGWPPMVTILHHRFRTARSSSGCSRRKAPRILSRRSKPSYIYSCTISHTRRTSYLPARVMAREPFGTQLEQICWPIKSPLLSSLTFFIFMPLSRASSRELILRPE